MNDIDYMKRWELGLTYVTNNALMVWVGLYFVAAVGLALFMDSAQAQRIDALEQIVLPASADGLHVP